MTTINSQARADVILIGDRNNLTNQAIKSIQPERVNIIVESFDGYNKSLNKGFKRAKTDYIAFCNNDLVFHNGWLDPLIKALDDYDSVSPWCPETHRQWWDSMPSGIYSSFEVGKCIAGWFIMMKRETYEKIGGFDERLDFWCADNSYAEQLKSLGMKHALVPESLVTHLQSQTLNRVDKSLYEKYTRGGIQKFNKLYNKKLFS